MASIDAPLLGLGAAFSEDLLRPLVRPNTTRTKFLKRARLSVAASGGLVALSAYFLQLNNSSIPVALKFYGAAMGPVMGLLILGVCTKWRLRRAGARIVALVGCLGAGCLIFFDGFFDGPQWYVYFISGAAAAVCAGAWSYRKFESAKDGR
jgi:Na+/proline symporter